MDDSNPDKNNQNENEIFNNEENSEDNNQDKEKENIIDIDNINDLNNKSLNNEINNINYNIKSFENETKEKQETENKIIDQEINESPEEEEQNENNIDIESQKDIDIENEKDIDIDNKNNNVKEEKCEEEKNNINYAEEEKKEKDIIEEEMKQKEERMKRQKTNNEDIIKEANKEPNLDFQKNELNPLKNKIDNENDNNEKDPQFLNKFKDLKKEITKNDEINELNKRKNIFEFTFTKNNNNTYRNNRYKNKYDINYMNKDSDINFKVYDPISVNENRYKELKEKYIPSNTILFSQRVRALGSYDKYFHCGKSKPSFISYKHNFTKSNNYMCTTNDKPIIYQKNVQKIKTDKKNGDLYNLLNSTDRIDLILKKIKDSKKYNFEERKNEINEFNFNKYKLLYNSKCINNNSYKKYTKGKKPNLLYKSVNLDNSSNKLKNLIKDVLDEIKSQNIKNYTYRKNKNYINGKMFRTTNANLNNLINLCTKENLKKYSESAKKGF
jgi:chemotaxis protein histidine kinase CheA